jgi:hypothetical protein
LCQAYPHVEQEKQFENLETGLKLRDTCSDQENQNPTNPTLGKFDAKGVSELLPGIAKYRMLGQGVMINRIDDVCCVHSCSTKRATTKFEAVTRFHAANALSVAVPAKMPPPFNWQSIACYINTEKLPLHPLNTHS